MQNCVEEFRVAPMFRKSLLAHLLLVLRRHKICKRTSIIEVASAKKNSKIYMAPQHVRGWWQVERRARIFYILIHRLLRKGKNISSSTRDLVPSCKACTYFVEIHSLLLYLIKDLLY